MPSQDVLHRAQADYVPFSQNPLGCATQELIDEALHIRVRQSVPYPPDARDTTIHSRQVVAVLVLATGSQASFRKSFLQVSTVRVTADKLHPVNGRFRSSDRLF